MDPNANLAEQDQLLNADTRIDKQRRSELRRALQDWLNHGGFAPAWTKYPEATKAYKHWVRQSAKFADLWR